MTYQVDNNVIEEVEEAEVDVVKKIERVAR